MRSSTESRPLPTADRAELDRAVRAVTQSLPSVGGELGLLREDRGVVRCRVGDPRNRCSRSERFGRVVAFAESVESIEHPTVAAEVDIVDVSLDRKSTRLN